MVRVCSRFGRSTRWSGRCAPTWSGNSTSILQRCATFRLESSLILPVQVLIQRWYSLSRHQHHFPTRLREIMLTQVRVPLFPLSLPVHRCPKMRPLFPVPRSEHTPHHPPIPQKPHTRPRLLPRHRFRRKRCPMLTLARSSHLTSPPSHLALAQTWTHTQRTHADKRHTCRHTTHRTKRKRKAAGGHQQQVRRHLSLFWRWDWY